MPSQEHSYREFRKHYEEYLDKIYAYLYFRSGKNKQLAEDLTSEVFLKALEKYESFDPHNSTFGAWVYTIARNHLIDHYRVKKVMIPIDDVPEAQLAEHEDLGAQLDQTAEFQKVVRGIELLPESYRDILTMKYIQGLTNEEIGAKLQKTQTNVRVLLHRSIAALKKILD